MIYTLVELENLPNYTIIKVSITQHEVDNNFRAMRAVTNLLMIDTPRLSLIDIDYLAHYG